MKDPPGLQVFYLIREKDVSGVSGVGVVAIGVVWPSEKVTIEWIVSDIESQTTYDNIDELIRVHGHEGSTHVMMGDFGNRCRACNRRFNKPKVKNNE